MPKKPYYKVDNEKMIVSFVVEKLTENEVKAVKNYIAFGYKPNAVKTEQLFPKKESLYTFTKERTRSVLPDPGGPYL